MHQVQIHSEPDLTESQVKAIVTLVNSIWPDKDKTISELIADWLAQIRQMQKSKSGKDGNHATHFLISEGNKAIAHARIFPREIYTPDGLLKVAALASVCVDANHRGEGLGAAVVRCAFEMVDRGTFPVSLFQTGVPGFYERLGARSVDNKFVNSGCDKDAEASPWWDKYVMIYPGEYPWPEGTIDLNGPGY